MSTISASTTTTTAYKVTADTTGALVLQTGATPTTAVTISSAQVVTLANALAEASGGTGTTTGYYGFKNRILNGSMVIDQRNAGASVTITSNAYTLDRWLATVSASSKFSVQQNAGSITPPAGFTKYLGCTSLSAYSIGAGDYFLMRQPVEGFNTADLGWGTANAQTITVSFWVRSSLTGTFGGALENNATNRSYPFSYTISAANTWETKSITIAGDTSGTWATDNSIGVMLAFGLGVGSTWSGTAGSWSSTRYFSATGATSVVGTNGATFYITGVQLEKGSTATSFDYRPYGTEMSLCQRYYSEVGKQLVGRTESTSLATMSTSTAVKMRVAPTASIITTGSAVVIPGVASYTLSSISAQSTTDNAVYISLNTSTATMTSGTVILGAVDRVLGLSSEL